MKTEKKILFAFVLNFAFAILNFGVAFSQEVLLSFPTLCTIQAMH